LEIEVQCPNCNRKISIPLSEIKPNNKKKCPYCRLEMTFTGDDLSKIEKEIKNFEKNLKKLFKS